jgi:hypothetical protein
LYGPIHLIDCGVYDDGSVEAEWILRDAEDNVFIGAARGRPLEDFETQWFSWGGITLQSNLLPNPLVYLRRGQPKHVIRAFYNSLAANVYERERTFCEHPIQDYGVGAGPFFKSPDESAFIVWFRHLLVAEDEDELILMGAVPDAWVAPGERIAVRGVPTWFGPMSMEVACSSGGETLSVELSAPRRNPPRLLRLRIPGTRPIRGVEVDGKAFRQFDADRRIIRLPGDVGEAEISVTF